MTIALELTPKTKRAPGEPSCEPVVYPEVERSAAERMAEVAEPLSGVESDASCCDPLLPVARGTRPSRAGRRPG